MTQQTCWPEVRESKFLSAGVVPKDWRVRSRMWLGFIELGLSSLAVLVLAIRLGHSLRLGSRALDSLTVIVLWCALVSTSVWLAGVAGVLHGHLLAAFLSILGIAVLGEGTSHRRLGNGIAYARTLFERAWCHHRLLLALCLAGVLFLGVRMVLHAWWLTPYVYDVLTYHLPKVADWVQEGRLVALPTPVIRSFWPAGFELLLAWCCLFVRHDVLVELAGVPFYVLGVGAVACLGRGLGLPRSYAAAAAMCFAFTPAFLQNATACKNDIAIGGLYLYCVALLMPPITHSSHRMHRDVLVALSLLMAIGIKPTMLFMVPGLVLLYLWRGRNGGVWWRDLHGLRRCRLVHLLSLLAAGTVSAYWYVRNAALFGNPLYPVPSHLLGAHAWVEGDAGTQQGGLSLSSLWQNLSALFGERLLDANRRIDPELGGMAGWGWFVVACGLPALLLGLLRFPVLRRPAMAFALSACILLSAVNHDPWNLRFMIWFPAIACVAFAAVLEVSRPRTCRDALALTAVICCILNGIAALGPGYYSADQWHARIEQPWAERQVWAGQEAMLERMPRSETLAYHLHGNHWIYPLYRPDFTQKIRYVAPVAGEGFGPAMRRMGLAYVFVPPASPLHDVFRKEATNAGFEDLDHNLYRLRQEPVP